MDRAESQKPAVLETIRRALGRLATQTRVREVAIQTLARPVGVHRRSVRQGARAVPGALENEINSPKVAIGLLDPPRSIIAGGALRGDRDARSLFYCRVSSNSAVVGLAESSRIEPSIIVPARVHMAEGAVATPHVKLAVARPSGGQARQIAALGLQKKAKIGRRLTAKNGLPTVRQPRVARVPASMAERVPLDRQRLPMPPRDSLEWQGAYLQERQLLAHAAGAGVPFTDIDLVGVYRKVPITAARRLEVEKGTNSLLLYLRPQVASRADPAQKPIVSIAIGRVKTDGRLVRAVIKG